MSLSPINRAEDEIVSLLCHSALSLVRENRELPAQAVIDLSPSLFQETFIAFSTSAGDST